MSMMARTLMAVVAVRMTIDDDGGGGCGDGMHSIFMTTRATRVPNILFVVMEAYEGQTK